jgi:hypothetical protein
MVHHRRAGDCSSNRCYCPCDQPAFEVLYQGLALCSLCSNGFNGPSTSLSAVIPCCNISGQKFWKSQPCIQMVWAVRCTPVIMLGVRKSAKSRSVSPSIAAISPSPMKKLSERPGTSRTTCSATSSCAARFPDCIQTSLEA